MEQHGFDKNCAIFETNGLDAKTRGVGNHDITGGYCCLKMGCFWVAPNLKFAAACIYYRARRTHTRDLEGGPYLAKNMSLMRERFLLVIFKIVLYSYVSKHCDININISSQRSSVASPKKREKY